MTRLNNSIPGVQATLDTFEREWKAASPANSPPVYLPGGCIINGAKSRDLLNTGNTDVLRPGLLMGKITATKKYAPSIIGVTTVAYVDNDLTLTVAAATAAELVRRIGASGTLKLTGPPTAAGTVATTSVAYTAVNATTGVITVPDLNVAAIAGSFLRPADGSEVPMGVLDKAVKVTNDAGTDQDTQCRELCVAAFAVAAQLIYYPSDTSLITWLKGLLNDPTNGPGPFRFIENWR